MVGNPVLLELTWNLIEMVSGLLSPLSPGQTGETAVRSDRIKEDFIVAQKAIRTSGSDIVVQALNGCCYGRDRSPDKGLYYKYCGQTFWKFISGVESLYTDIVEPLGCKAKEKNEEFLNAHAEMIASFHPETHNI